MKRGNKLMSIKYKWEAGSSSNVNNCEQDYYYGILHKHSLSNSSKIYPQILTCKVFLNI